jgi:Sigma-70 region 2
VLTRLGESRAGADEPADGVARAAPAGGSRLTDADIVRASIGDPGRFGELFDRYADDIVRYASARLGSNLAEDVTAETFLAAFHARGRYDQSRESARPWLYGIAIRQIGKHCAVPRLRRSLKTSVTAWRTGLRRSCCDRGCPRSCPPCRGRTASCCSSWPGAA